MTLGTWDFVLTSALQEGALQDVVLIWVCAMGHQPLIAAFDCQDSSKVYTQAAHTSTGMCAFLKLKVDC
jgi:hypothetical protein